MLVLAFLIASYRQKGFQLSKDWKITINGNVENVYVNVTFNNVTIYNKSGGGVLGSSKAKAQSIEDRVAEKVSAPPKSPTLQEIATSLSKELKDGVNGNMTKEEFEAGGNTLDQAFKDVVPVTANTNPVQTIAEWFDSLPDKEGKVIGQFIKYLRDDCGLDSINSADLVDDIVKNQLSDFLTSS